MATLKQRLHRYNGSSYDTVHFETDSSLVLRPDGTTVEGSLPEVQASDDAPETLASGKILVGTSKVFIGINNLPYEVATSAANEEIDVEPSVASNPTYNGSSRSPSWNNYDSTKLTISGDTSATNQGTYTVGFTPKKGYVWASTLDRRIVYKTWTLNPATPTITAPTAKTLTYTGSSQTLVNAGSTTFGTLLYAVVTAGSSAPASSAYVSSLPSAINAGSYDIYCRVDADATNGNWTAVAAAKKCTVTISKAANTMSLSKTSITLNSTTKSTTFTISGNYDGTLSVSSDNTSVVTVSRSGSTVTVSSVNDTNGTATVTVSASGGNYTAASKTCSVTCSFIEDGEYGSKVISGTKTKGSTVKFDGIEWIVANVSGSTYTLMKKVISEKGTFGSSTTYSGSNAASWCSTFQNAMSANALSVVNSKTKQSVTAKVWLPLKSDVQSWTDSNDPTSNDWYTMRKWTAGDSTDPTSSYAYWCCDPDNSSAVWRISYNGYFGYNTPSTAFGFRPCIEVTQ